MKFGSSGKELHLLIDTGAANTWVMSSNCTAAACGLHNTFGASDSTTLAVTDASWNVTYGTGTVSGLIVNDTISLAGISLPFSFGVASEVSDDFLSYPMDGILGLARLAPDELNVPTLMDALKREQKLKSSLVGISLQLQYDKSNDGEISFGDWDRSKVDGDITWVNTLSKTGIWEVAVDDAGVENKFAEFTGRSAIIDTGSSFVLLPPDDAKKLHALFPGVRQTGGTYELPCASTAQIQFTFGGVPFNMSSKDYVGNRTTGDFCFSNIQGRQTFGPDQWLMGDAFLKSVYSIFDFDQSRIGNSDLRKHGG